MVLFKFIIIYLISPPIPNSISNPTSLLYLNFLLTNLSIFFILLLTFSSHEKEVVECSNGHYTQ